MATYIRLELQKTGALVCRGAERPMNLLRSPARKSGEYIQKRYLHTHEEITHARYICTLHERQRCLYCLVRVHTKNMLASIKAINPNMYIEVSILGIYPSLHQLLQFTISYELQLTYEIQEMMTAK